MWKYDTETNLNSWHDVDWNEVKANVKEIRQRIYVSSKQGDRKRTRDLQRLMLKSRANWLEAIRRVTQINQGRRTPGVDREVITTPEERVELFNWLGTIDLKDWRPPATRRVEIPKKSGKKRPLGIPTVKDRIIQAIAKNALEPEWEALFEGSSHGFRPGRSPHDAIQDVWSALKGNSLKEWVVDADIKGAFDNIDHDYLIEQLQNFPAQKLIERWLKAGVMIDLDLTPTEAGTPQGGVISPLLANIALHGLDNDLRDKVKNPTTHRWRTARRVIRYADDFVIVCETKEDAEKAKSMAAEWLSIRGLELSEEKTQIVHISTGFDFLGFNIKRYKAASAKKGYAIHCKPSAEAIERFKQKVNDAIRRNQSPDVIIAKLNPLIRGWGNYYRIGVAKRLFSKLDHFIWQRLYGYYSRRRHPNKGKRWRKTRYFTKDQRGRDWTFYDRTTKRQITYLANIPIIRHAKVKPEASPDDPTLTEYWENRRKKPRQLPKVKGILWTRQKGKCPICNDWLDNGEELHTHHMRGRGEERLQYKQLLHETCHIQVTIKARSA